MKYSLKNMRNYIVRGISLGLVASMAYFSSGCANVRPHLSASTNGNGDLEAKAGLEMGKESKRPFYKKKGFLYTLGGVAIAAVVYGLSNGSGSSGSDYAQPEQTSTDTEDNDDKKDNKKDDKKDSGGSGNGGGSDKGGDL